MIMTLVAVDAPAARAEVPPFTGQDFIVDDGDLDFILDQINIAEGHARRAIVDSNASPLCSGDAEFDAGLNLGYNSPGQTWYEPDGTPCVGHPNLPHGLRTVTGRWNNLYPGQLGFGAANMTFPRIFTPEWRDTEPAPPFAPLPAGTSYSEHVDGTFYYDSEPRLISNLIVDQTGSNPAAAAVYDRFCADGLDARANGATCGPDDENSVYFFQNVAADEGLSAPFSTFMTFFGQFFDHGLDLVTKGGNGTVIMPLHPSDPNYVPGGQTNFMALTRATIQDGTLHEAENRTTPFIDQNQTYSSHPAHQVFLREYELVGGVPVPTGHLIEGTGGGLATWADVKNQALNVLGIELDDHDVHAVPLVVTDPYGRFVPGENGFPIVETPGGPVPASLGAPVDASGAVKINQAFLDDIAHGAVPQFDGDGNPIPASDPIDGFDSGLLGAHFVAGDGRVNENIALTAVHHVFHSEHNRLATQIDAYLQSLPVGHALRVGYEEGYDPLNSIWDYNERVFQAAKFVTEMQYQHLAVEEFLRTVSPNMPAVPLNETSYEANRNAAITAEFAHVVYRFGHSMLTEELPRTWDNGTDGSMSLLSGFLNPAAYMAGASGPQEAAGSLIRGLANQPGNGIDEFVTDTLRNSLLGLTLDLAAINMARGRDTGMPGLQAARQQIYNATFDPTLRPYADWHEFMVGMKNPESIVNFVAAYGDDPSITGVDMTATDALDQLRAAATALVDGSYTNPVLREGLIEGSFMDTSAGLENIDLWMGGLAERTEPFGGMLGSTFNYVFESQATALQNGDRFYYLVRNQGRNLFSQLEANSFSELIQRNTTATENDLHFNVFSFPDPTFPDTSNITFTGGEHILIGGTGGDDVLFAGLGDDTVWGEAGNDRIEGGAGNDSLIGGAGHDIITDSFGDDKILGGSGDDAIAAGPGDNLVLAGSGNDFVNMAGALDGSQTFAMAGNDFILGSNATDQIWGNLGDDWIEGGGGTDLLQGDNAIGSQNDPRGGADVIIGGGGSNDFDSDGGDDIMVANQPGVNRFEGMHGFDWASFQGREHGVDADMSFTGLMPPDIQNIRDRFDLVEGLSGTMHNDVLRGIGRLDDAQQAGHTLTAEGIARIDGLGEMLDVHTERFAATDGPYLTNNILLGGGGDDLIEGRGGDDFIDGDASIEVLIGPGGWTSLAEIAAQLMTPGGLTPSDLFIIRQIRTDAGTDTAKYSGAVTDYTIVDLGGGYWEVTHNVDGGDGSDILRNVENLQFANTLCAIADCVALSNADPGADPTPTVAIGGTVEVGQQVEALISDLDPDAVITAIEFVGVLNGNSAVLSAPSSTSTTFTLPNVVPGTELEIRVRYVLDEAIGEIVSDRVAIVGGTATSGGTGGGGGGGGTSVLGAVVASFTDVPESSIFAIEIAWLASQGITVGCNAEGTLFCPQDEVSRGQMAAFLTRALGLPDGLAVFDDTAEHQFEEVIAALADAGITQGCNADGTEFCPDESVTRGQMAAFLTRALDLAPGDQTFDDTVGHQFEAEIAALAAAGITQGCNEAGTDFCPDDPVTREQMAAFLYRALNEES